MKKENYLIIIDGISKVGKTSFIKRNKGLLGIDEVVHPFGNTGILGHTLRHMYDHRQSDIVLTKPEYMYAAIGCHFAALEIAENWLYTGSNVCLDRCILSTLVYNAPKCECCDGLPHSVSGVGEAYAERLLRLMDVFEVFGVILDAAEPRSEFTNGDQLWESRNEKYREYSACTPGNWGMINAGRDIHHVDLGAEHFAEHINHTMEKP